MTKGPVGVLIPVLTIGVFWASQRFKTVIGWRPLMIAGCSVVVTIALWAIADLVRHGPEFMIGFFWRQVAMLTSEDAGHGGFFGYHFVVLLLGCFPASLFALQEMLERRTQPLTNERSLYDQQPTTTYRKWMLILFWVVLILFSIVKTKIVHYSSMCYFPLTYLAALQLERIWVRREGSGWSRYAVGAIGLLFALITLAVPFIGMHIDVLKPFLQQDPFALANMDAEVHWDLYAILPGTVLLVALIAGHILYMRGKFRASVISLFCGTALFVWLALYFFIGRVEGYSQRAAIEFFEERQNEKCYVITHGYKSYAQLFYTQKPMITDPRAYDEEWLLKSVVDRPVYVVCKVTSADEVTAIPTLKELYRKNGFVFFEKR